MYAVPIGPELAEYKLFTDYYCKLVDTLPASDLSHYFVSARVISLADHEEIVRSSTPQKAARLLLDRVSQQLQNGNSSVFNKMLLIMEHHGIATAKIVAKEVRDNLLEMKLNASSSVQGRKFLMIVSKIYSCYNVICITLYCMENYVIFATQSL